MLCHFVADGPREKVSNRVGHNHLTAFGKQVETAYKDLLARYGGT
jgi:hypothetical protein